MEALSSVWQALGQVLGRGLTEGLWPGAAEFARELGMPGESWAAKLLRPVLVYAFLLVGLRVAGRRELAQLNVFDLVVLLTLSNTVQNAIIGNDNSVLGGLAGATILLATNYAVVRFLYRHPTVDAALEGSPVMLIRDGRVLEDNLRRELITPDELLAAVHRQGIDRIDQVAFAVLETSGAITVIARRPQSSDAGERMVAARLDDLAAEVRALRASLAARSGDAGGAPAAPPGV